MLSIIVPTYNEEKYLPRLLESIKRQDIKYELIIADNSKDKTQAIVKSYDCIIVDGGNPSKARNNGAKKATYENLLFLDADVILPDNFLKMFLKRAIKFDYGTCKVLPTLSRLDYRMYYFLKNYANIIISPLSAHISGQCFFIKKQLFRKLNGFDESLFFGEEHDLAKRAKQIAKGKFFTDIFVYNVPRRLQKEGTFRTLLLDMYSEVYRFFKPAKHKIYNKKYGHY